MSIQPPLVLERARRVLAAPSSVTFELRSDTLVANGAAPASWIARSAALAAAVPGVSHADFSRLTESLPAALEGLRSEIEAVRVVFPLGSAGLLPAERARVAALAASVNRLVSEGARLGYRARLALVGRTDPTGSENANRALSEQRADAVRAALVSLGVAAGALELSGVGSSSPLPARDAAERALINRSVSFAVRLHAERSAGAERESGR